MGSGTSRVHIVQRRALHIGVAREHDRHVLENLLQLYLYEMSDFDAREMDETGRYPCEFLEEYWHGEGRVAVLARAGRSPAGFALVQEQSILDPRSSGVRSIAEFFVLRPYRRLGIGREMALEVFRRFTGRWEVRVAEGNEPAKAFWRRVIEEYTGGRFVELMVDDHRWRGPVQTFDNSLMVG